MQVSLQLPAQSGGTAMQPAAGDCQDTVLRVSATDRNDKLVNLEHRTVRWGHLTYSTTTCISALAKAALRTELPV